MSLQLYFIKQAVKCARDLYAQFGMSLLKTPVHEPVNLHNGTNLILLATTAAGKLITLYRPDIGDSKVDAFIAHYEEKADIFVANSSHINYCHLRFLSCKELMHVFLYSPSEGNQTATCENAKELLQGILNHLQTQAQVENPQICTDYAAYFGAIELLMPSANVSRLRQLKQAFETEKLFPGNENFELAKLLGVPEFIVELRLDPKNDYLFITD